MDSENVSIVRRDHAFIVTLTTDEFQGEVANELFATLTAAISEAESPRIVLDLSNVTFVDSLSLGTLVKIAGDLSRRQGKLMISGVRDPVRRTLALTRLTKLFQLYKTADEALIELSEHDNV